MYAGPYTKCTPIFEPLSRPITWVRENLPTSTSNREKQKSNSKNEFSTIPNPKIKSYQTY